MTDKTNEVYAKVTEQMITALENADANDFKMPWNSMSQMPTNLASKKPYRGMNIFILWFAAQEAGYTSPYWLTFKQGKELGGMVRKGEKSTGILFWNIIEKKDADTGEKKKVALARTYRVFNVEQFDGIEAPTVETFNNDTIAEVDAVVAKTGALIEFGNEFAAYNFRDDKILMPNLDRFHSTEGYYETLLHELTHWTGHCTRCDRALVGKHDYENYAKEELVAEMGSAFLCAQFGIEGNLQHPEYIKDWIAALKDDDKALSRAAGMAQLACDFILGKKFDDVKEAA